METSEESSENGVSDVISPEDPVAMTTTRKFLFDTVFDVEEPIEEEDDLTEEDEEAEPEVIVPTFSEEEMKTAREESFAAGKAEGVNEAAEATERQIFSTLEKVGQQFDGIFKAQEAANATIMENAISVACGIARKAFPALNKQGALAEIERMAVLSMGKILEEPQVTLAVNPEFEASLKERLSTLKAQAGYKGEVKIIAGDGIAPGDCSMEWDGGGAQRDMDALWQEIDEIVERNLSENPEASKPVAEEPMEPAGDNEEKADSGELAEAEPEQPADTDQEPQTGSSEETPEAPGDEDTTTEQEGT